MMMTDEGKCWDPFKMTDELAERMAAGEMAALAEFVAENDRFLRCWARKILRNYINVIPEGQYEADDCINQIFVDFLYYDYTDAKMLTISIFKSYIGIARGGFNGRVYHKDNFRTISLDAPIGISARSGDKEDGATLGELLPGKDLAPDEEIVQREHVEEVIPLFYREVMRVFGNECTEQAREVLETVFAGFTFGEIVRYAERVA